MIVSRWIKAYLGKRIWEKLYAEYGNIPYILMPETDEEYNYYALLYLDDYLESKAASTALILTGDLRVEKAADLFVESAIDIRHMSKRNIAQLLQYYALYEFSPRLVVVSRKKPYDTGAENLLGIKGITKEDLVCFDLYHLGKNPGKHPPKYAGGDKDILQFLGCKARVCCAD